MLRYIFGVLLGLMRGPQVEEAVVVEVTEEEKIGQLRIRSNKQSKVFPHINTIQQAARSFTCAATLVI